MLCYVDGWWIEEEGVSLLGKIDRGVVFFMTSCLVWFGKWGWGELGLTSEGELG
jgi:hypothetical protein